MAISVLVILIFSSLLNVDTQAVRCKKGQVHFTCQCIKTCDNLKPDCSGCSPGCACYGNTPVLYNENCIHKSQCPPLKGLVCPEGSSMTEINHSDQGPISVTYSPDMGNDPLAVLTSQSLVGIPRKKIIITLASAVDFIPLKISVQREGALAVLFEYGNPGIFKTQLVVSSEGDIYLYQKFVSLFKINLLPSPASSKGIKFGKLLLQICLPDKLTDTQKTKNPTTTTQSITKLSRRRTRKPTTTTQSTTKPINRRTRKPTTPISTTELTKRRTRRPTTQSTRTTTQSTRRTTTQSTRTTTQSTQKPIRRRTRKPTTTTESTKRPTRRSTTTMQPTTKTATFTHTTTKLTITTQTTMSPLPVTMFPETDNENKDISIQGKVPSNEGNPLDACLCEKLKKLLSILLKRQKILSDLNQQNDFLSATTPSSRKIFTEIDKSLDFITTSHSIQCELKLGDTAAVMKPIVAPNSTWRLEIENEFDYMKQVIDELKSSSESKQLIQNYFSKFHNRILKCFEGIEKCIVEEG